MTQAEAEKIKEVAQGFFEKMGLGITLEIKSLEGETLPIDLKMADPQILIGERGQTLAETQHLLKAVLRKSIATTAPFYVDLDINDYKKKKTEYLKEMACSFADEVVLTRKEKELSPMPAYERRIIHLALAGREDVLTESVGEGPERRIIIKCRS
jgi:spoIIIJ-associated protein